MTGTIDQQDGGTPADRMAALFDRQGFAGTSVDDLRATADMSLRTLYRRYGSREQMVVAALESRAERYLGHLSGSASVRELFERTATYMGDASPLGCLFLRARADHPGDPAIDRAVSAYHASLRAQLVAAAEAEGLAGDVGVEELFVLHEGLLATAPAIGPAAALAAATAALDRAVTGGTG